MWEKSVERTRGSAMAEAENWKLRSFCVKKRQQKRREKLPSFPTIILVDMAKWHATLKSRLRQKTTTTTTWAQDEPLGIIIMRWYLNLVFQQTLSACHNLRQEEASQEFPPIKLCLHQKFAHLIFHNFFSFLLEVEIPSLFWLFLSSPIHSFLRHLILFKYQSAKVKEVTNRICEMRKTRLGVDCCRKDAQQDDGNK